MKNFWKKKKKATKRTSKKKNYPKLQVMEDCKKKVGVPHLTRWIRGNRGPRSNYRWVFAKAEPT